MPATPCNSVIVEPCSSPMPHSSLVSQFVSVNDDYSASLLGLDAAGSSGPLGSAGVVVGNGAEEVEQVLGLGGDGL